MILKGLLEGSKGYIPLKMTQNHDKNDDDDDDFCDSFPKRR